MSGFPGYRTRDLGPSVVYRFYDDEGELLYVGCTNSTARRFAEHMGGRKNRGWQNIEVAGHSVTPFDTRAEAERAEAVAIFTERPIHNSTQPNSWHRRLYGSVPIADQQHRIRERVAARLGTDPGAWAFERRQAADKVAWAQLTSELIDMTQRVPSGLSYWARDYGEDPWARPVEIGYRLPSMASFPVHPYAYESESWRAE